MTVFITILLAGTVAVAGFALVCYLSFLLVARIAGILFPVESEETRESKRIDAYFRQVYQSDMSKSECDALNAERWID